MLTSSKMVFGYYAVSVSKFSKLVINIFFIIYGLITSTGSTAL